MSEQAIDQKVVNHVDSKIPLVFMFLYNYLRILSFSNLKEIVNIDILVTISMYGLLLSLLPNLLVARYRWNLLYIVISIIGIMISNFDGVTNYVTIIVVAITLANQDIKPYAKAIYYSLIVGSVTVLLLRFTGLIPDRVVVSPRGVMRYSLGFGSARGLSESYLMFCQLFVYLKFDVLKKRSLFWLFIPIIPINIITDSRATTLLGVLFIVLVLLIKLKGNEKRITSLLYRVTSLAYCISAITIFLGSYYYKVSPFWTKLDAIVSNRFQFGNWYLRNFPVKFLGQWIPIDVDQNTLLTQYNTSYLMLDSGHMTMLIEGGLLITIIMTVIIFASFKKMKNKRDNIGLLIWFIAALNLFQTRLLNPATLEVLLLAQVFELSSKNSNLKFKEKSDVETQDKNH